MFARFLAIAALLFVLGEQVLEAAHYHAGNEPVASCVQCHASSGAALLTTHTGILAIAFAIMSFFLRSQASPTPTVFSALARGPPLYS